VIRLSEDEYKATMGPNPRQVGSDELPPFDFWAYFDALPREEWMGHDFSRGTVSYAYVMPGDRWEHVLVESDDKNVNLVLLLDLDAQQVHGHFLLDLNEMYGLKRTE
jgi:hypothetical protein